MNVRLATERDLPALLKIYSDARRYMRERGNLTQWSGGYPSESLLREDIAGNRLHVVCEGDDLLAVFYFRIGEDPTYRRIYEGAWKNDAPYAVIHRIAVSESSHGKGVAAFCFSYCYGAYPNLKIDTHRDNLPMQRALLKNGFQPCGIIYLPNGDPRLAYQRCEE